MRPDASRPRAVSAARSFGTVSFLTEAASRSSSTRARFAAGSSEGTAGDAEGTAASFDALAALNSASASSSAG